MNDLAKKIAHAVFELIPDDPQEDRGEFDVAVDTIDKFLGNNLPDVIEAFVENERDLEDALSVMDDDSLINLASELTNTIRKKFVGMDDFSILDDNVEVPADVVKTYWVVYQESGGGTRYVLNYFDTEEDANSWCESLNWTYIDDNGFQWNLDVDDEVTTEKDLTDRMRPAKNVEFTSSVDDDFDW